jgi:hypothetical protein
LTAVVGEVGEDDAEVDEAGEEASAEATDAGRRDLGNVDGSDDGCLSYAEPGDEPAGVDSPKTAVGPQEDGDADNPQDAELAGGPDAADSIADKERTVTSRLSPLVPGGGEGGRWDKIGLT